MTHHLLSLVSTSLEDKRPGDTGGVLKVRDDPEAFGIAMALCCRFVARAEFGPIARAASPELFASAVRRTIHEGAHDLLERFGDMDSALFRKLAQAEAER